MEDGAETMGLCWPTNDGSIGLRDLSAPGTQRTKGTRFEFPDQDRKSTRLNSSHALISYAVFCLKKKKRKKKKKKYKTHNPLHRRRVASN